MYKKLFMNWMLSSYSLERMFEALQIKLPKMKRKTEFLDDTIFYESKPYACIPHIAVTRHIKPNSFLNKNIQMVILKWI